MKPAAIVLDRNEQRTIYRVKAGGQGKGKTLGVIRDRGYSIQTIIRELTWLAETRGYEVKEIR